MPESILNKIKQYKIKEVKNSKKKKPIVDLEFECKNITKPRGFKTALLSFSQHKYAIIAEVKKASPSKGVLRKNFDPVKIAKSYEAGGARCISVLTDYPSFQGKLDHISQIRNEIKIPILRKDFMIDPYQVVEARSVGADCILIIMALLTDIECNEIESAAFSMGLDAILEVHNLTELERALNLKSTLIGINNRNLKSFETTLDVTKTLKQQVPSNIHVISESGIHSRDDLDSLSQYGVHSFLIGESLIKKKNIELALRDLLKT